jgi:hypothetical protein
MPTSGDVMGEQEKSPLKWRKTMKRMAVALAVTTPPLSAPAFADKGNRSPSMPPES